MADERYVCTMAPFFPMGSFGPYLISPCISIILCGLQKRFEELFLTVCLLSENIIQPECRTVNSKSVKQKSVESLKCISGIVYIPHDCFKPGRRHGTSHVTEQRNACLQQFLAETKQSVAYRLHMTLYVKLIDNKPVMPSYHSVLRKTCF